MSGTFVFSDTFIRASAPLTPLDAVAAIILDEAGRALLQLRDDKPDIFFPNHWGCFGGAIEPGETPQQTLLRELEEELGIAFDAAEVEPYIKLWFNPRPGARAVERHFFIVKIKAAAIRQLRLGEGHAYEFFTPEAAMRIPNATPYDKFGLWLYFNRERLRD